MGEIVVGLGYIVTCLTGFAQIVAFFRRPYFLALFALRLVILAIWVGCCFAAGLGILVFNYCEHDCPSLLNGPTVGIVLAILLINAFAIWLTWFAKLDARS